jgi:hypothetical protein
MKSIRSCFAAIFFIGHLSAADLQPVLIAPGPVIVAESFDAAALSDTWHIRNGEWVIKDGILTGKKTATDKHPAKLELMRPWQDGVLQFAFQLSERGGMDLDLYQGETRVAVLRMRAESLSFGSYPKTGPSKATILSEAEGGFAPGVWHHVIIERKGTTFHIQRDHGTALQATAPDLAPGFTSGLFILRGEPGATVQMDDVKLTGAK